MIIRPHGTEDQQIPYATGRFSEGDAFVVNQIGAASPFGGLLCSFGSDYAIEVLPDGSGCSWYMGQPVSSPARLGKAWYIRDKDSGETWSAFFSPMGAKSDEYEITYQPGQVTAFCLKNKIGCSLTIASVPCHSYELWSIEMENRSARHRTLQFTTYVELAGTPMLEALYRTQEKALLMRRPLGAGDVGPNDGPVATSVIFHSSTLTPARFAIERSDFIGDGRTLSNPAYLEDYDMTGESDCVPNPIAALTVELELPIEGGAEFGFCFGVAPTPESAISSIHAFSRHEGICKAIEDSRAQWDELSSTVRVDTTDRALNALINTWLPYESYAGWIREHKSIGALDPARVADVLRCLYPVTGNALDSVRRSLLRFAAGLTLLGSYAPDSQSLVSLPPSEMLWLVIATAGYIAESGDKSVLVESIALKDGPVLPLQEHCERIIRLCINAKANADGEDARLLAETIKLWALISTDLKDVGQALEMLDQKQPDRERYSERRTLPRKVRYLQSLSPTLMDKVVLDDLIGYLGGEETGGSDVDAACSLYASLVQRALGITATFEGLVLSPKLPDSWQECEITRRFRGDTYHIRIRRKSTASGKSASIVVDGEPVLGEMLPFFGDAGTHEVDVTIG